jgi:GrpB-like predicted nucleotidyltransferase (UPF0157 family)
MSEQPRPECLQPPVRADGPIRLADPDPEWAAQYARERAHIRSALGPRAVQVEHVGATSVPGLAAKPVIDIVLTVIDSSDEPGYPPDLQLLLELHQISGDGAAGETPTPNDLTSGRIKIREPGQL